jgi:hypothetical protein
MWPERCQTTTIRCFVRNDSKYQEVKEMFQRFCLNRFGSGCVNQKTLSHSQMQDVVHSQSQLIEHMS